jgi:hypothetical protein
MLCAAGWVLGGNTPPPAKAHRATTTLSLEGDRILHGRSATALADFVVHTMVAARAAGMMIDDFQRENTLRLQVGGDFLYPDSSFTIRRPDGAAFHFHVELDNVTERVQSPGVRDSWQRKSHPANEAILRHFLKQGLGAMHAGFVAVGSTLSWGVKAASEVARKCLDEEQPDIFTGFSSRARRSRRSPVACPWQIPLLKSNAVSLWRTFCQASLVWWAYSPQVYPHLEYTLSRHNGQEVRYL